MFNSKKQAIFAFLNKTKKNNIIMEAVHSESHDYLRDFFLIQFI